VIQQPQSIQYQIIQTEDGVQMVQEIQTVQAVEAVEMPKVKEFLECSCLSIIRAIASAKGQLISKGHFGIFKSS